jgi:hypothetical protein
MEPVTFDPTLQSAKSERQGANVVPLRPPPRRPGDPVPIPRPPGCTQAKPCEACGGWGHTADELHCGRCGAIGEHGTNNCPELAADGRANYARSIQNREIAELVVAKIALAPAAALGPSTAPTLATFAKRWTSGELHTTYLDHVKKIDQDDNRERLAKLLATPLDGPWATLGDVPLDRVTVEHGFAAMQALPPMKRPTRSHHARALNRVLNLAVFPCRLITVNPLPKGFVPSPGKSPARAWWKPADDADLCCACDDVPLLFRFFYGFTFREGLRERRVPLRGPTCAARHARSMRTRRTTRARGRSIRGRPRRLPRGSDW